MMADLKQEPTHVVVASVDGCARCPLFTLGVGEDGDCNAAHRDIPNRFSSPPDWCPLRTAPVLVTLAVK